MACEHNDMSALLFFFFFMLYITVHTNLLYLITYKIYKIPMHLLIMLFAAIGSNASAMPYVG